MPGHCRVAYFLQKHFFLTLEIYVTVISATSSIEMCKMFCRVIQHIITTALLNWNMLLSEVFPGLSVLHKDTWYWGSLGSLHRLLDWWITAKLPEPYLKHLTYFKFLPSIFFFAPTAAPLVLLNDWRLHFFYTALRHSVTKSVNFSVINAVNAWMDKAILCISFRPSSAWLNFSTWIWTFGQQQ